MKNVSDFSKQVNHGFDLTCFDAGDFEEIVTLFELDFSVSEEGFFVWSNGSLSMTTNNDPITGVYYNGNRDPEIGYASYMGITGPSDLVAALVAVIKKEANYIKGESSNRDFI